MLLRHLYIRKEFGWGLNMARIKDWMKKAVKHPGAMTEAAKAAGETNSEFEQKHKGDSGHDGQMARLALIFKKNRGK